MGKRGPQSDKYIDKAVRLVVDSGYTPREAYEAVPQLQERGETVLQNLRKQVRTARAKLDAPPAVKKTIAKKQKKKKPAILPKGKRLRSDQVDAIAAEKAAKRQRRSAAHKEATSELVKAKERGGGRAAPGAKQQIVERVNDKFNLSPTSALTISGISQHVAIRGAGVSPELPGPKSTMPKELTKALGIRAQLMQLCGQEQGSRKLLASAMASVKGTDLEALLDSRGKRLRMVRAIKAACPELRTLQRKSADDRRAEWLCRSRLLRWFLGYVRLAAH